MIGPILVPVLVGAVSVLIADRVARTPRGRTEAEPIPTGPTGDVQLLLNPGPQTLVVPPQAAARAAHAAGIPASAVRLIVAHAALFTTPLKGRDAARTGLVVVGSNPMLLPARAGAAWTQTIEERQTPDGPRFYRVGVRVFDTLAAGFAAAWQALPDQARRAAATGNPRTYVHALVAAKATTRSATAFIAELRTAQRILFPPKD